MKTKMIQLLLLLMTVSLFGSSKENNCATPQTLCKLQCAEKTGAALPVNEKNAMAADEVDEYPFALAPGSYLLRY